jgi:hypothetical protein
LSPFQKGYGSLQLFSVCQPVPAGPESDFKLTGLRKDHVTSKALGVFREQNTGAQSAKTSDVEMSIVGWKSGMQIPDESPKVQFDVIDEGDLDEKSNPVYDDYDDKSHRIIVSPEVLHLSRFAERYRLYVDSDYPTLIELCQHNAHVSESLSQHELANMWKILALLLETCISNPLLSSDHDTHVLLPFIKDVLEERADAGDVQTCVAICEIFEMVRSDQSLFITSLEIQYIREWYLSYIDLLRDMCLFSHATFIIKNCRDPFIGALNQQSTTYVNIQRISFSNHFVV